MVEIIKEDIKPKCPHCEKEVDKLVEVKRKGWFVLNRVYCCPHCEKIVGMAANS